MTDRITAALEAATQVGPLSQDFLAAVADKRATYAVMRAKRSAITIPQVDRRVGERRIYERRAMQDTLDQAFDRRSDQRFSAEPVKPSAFIDLG